ncbi:MAG: winged helix-turn-helix transcriptional regulator [Nitrosotalea sp.]
MDSKIKNMVQCDVADIWHVLGKTWSLVILRNLSTNQTVRFNELKRLISGISSTVLSDRLAELEEQGLVARQVYQEVPTRVEYSLTKQARELEKILGDLGQWAGKWKPKQGQKKN